MEKRLITAIALSILIIVSFQYFIVKPQPSGGSLSTQPATSVAADKLTTSVETAEPVKLPEENTIDVAVGKYIVTFSNIGGAIKSIKLADLVSSMTSEPLEIVKTNNPRHYIFNARDVAKYDILDIAGYNHKQNDNEIIYTLFTKNFRIEKRYIISKSKHGIDLELSIKNISDSPKEISYELIGGAGIHEENARDRGLIEVISNVDGKKIGFKRTRDRVTNNGAVGWLALKNKYFSIILKPFGSTKSGFYFSDSDGNLVSGVDSEKTLIQPGATVVHKYSLYAGPSTIASLREFGYGIGDSLNYGMFGGISKALLVVLRWCHALTRNWGISIILLSILLNIILFPLTMKSFKSMQKMQELHPQMEKLKTQLKDNPQKLNKEIMELYKKYNINPFSGCLPVLLQMPIFISLYQALMKSFELRGASFLWIRDLSSPEAIPLPVSFPIIGNSINILPLVMVGAMVIQQRISTKTMGGAVTEEQKQQQKIMLIMMPVMFGFIFYGMPSGLVLYWVINTILTIVEQASVLKKE